MKDSYSLYSYIIKSAAPEDSPYYAPPRRSFGSRALGAVDAVGNLSGIYRGGKDVILAGARGAGSLRDTFYGTFNPFEDEGSRRNSMSYSVGREIGNFLVPKVYDPDDLGPYEEYSKYLKDTEEGDMLLREAAKLRRRARLIKREREQAEKEKQHASISRYF